MFCVGYDGDHEAFTIPERDGSYAIIGIATRVHHEDGRVVKKVMTGGKRGLTIPFGWRKRPGALFCVEGFTDTAAMTAADLCAVGRASNRHGAKLLAVLLQNWPVDRDIVIVGDNDLKPNGDWPGKVGADAVARQLAPC